jgi:hypothetical protein
MTHESATTAPKALGFSAAPFHDPLHACLLRGDRGIATAPATNTALSVASPVEIIDGQRVVTLSAAPAPPRNGPSRLSAPVPRGCWSLRMTHHL